MSTKTTNAQHSASILLGDDPKKTIDDDHFGLKQMVNVVSRNLDQHVTAAGYTLGVEGSWGSGKTTFASFLAELLVQENSAHEVIKFEPWLIGDRNSLLLAYFAELAARIDKIRKKTYPIWHINRWRRKSNLANKIRKYGGYLGALAKPILGASAFDASGTTAVVAVGLETMGIVSRFLGVSPTPIEHLKEQIKLELRDFPNKFKGTRFTIIIDDLDRLEPTEAVEILRLVSKVADFPNIRYVICFDKDILSSQVEAALNIKSGPAYIEKIFQNVISIPPQEPFAIRRYFRWLLEQSFPVEMGQRSVSDIDPTFRAHLLFDDWVGRFLKTPRDAIRVSESIKFGWPHVPSIDFYDFVWLQLVKLKLPALHSWVMRYVSNVGAYRDGGRAGDDEPKRESKDLHLILTDTGWEGRFYYSGLEYFLPGLRSFLFSPENSHVYDFSDGELAKFEMARRLGSPSHWRLYFAFDQPSYAINDNDISEFRTKASTDPDGLIAMLQCFAARSHTTPGHFLNVLLDRLAFDALVPFSPAEMRGMSTAFANVMDELAPQMGRRSGRLDLWERTYELLNKSSAALFVQLVEIGTSVNWLAYVIRRQGFAHGRPKGNASNPDKQWLNPAQLDEATAKLMSRLRSLKPLELFAKPEPLDILFCWLQLGDADELRRYIRDAIVDDKVFIAALNGMRSWSSSSERGTYYPLRAYNLSYFLNAKETQSRLQTLSSSNTVNPTLKQAAQEILAVWEVD